MMLNPETTSATEIPWYQVLHQPEPKPVKTALLTGGSGGIGAETRRLLEARGWTVIAPVKEDLDFRLFTSVIMEAKFRAYSVPIHTLVFCHGEWYSESVEEQGAFNFELQYNLRVSNPFELMKSLLDNLRQNHGSVIMISSTRGLIGGVNSGPYAAACAAQIALMQGYAREYAGVRFNVVCPGLTESRMTAQIRAMGGCKPDAIAQPPEAVAAEIVRLCESDDNGKVVRIVNSVTSEVAWQYDDIGGGKLSNADR